MRPGLKRPVLFGTLAKGVLLGRALAVMSGCDRTALGAGSQSGASSETVSSARALAEAKVRAAQSSYAASQAELFAAQRSLEQLNVTDADGDVPMQTYPADPTIETFTGASWNSQKELMKGHCDFCHRDFPHPSMVAYVLDEPPHFPFAKLQEPVVMKAVLKQVVNIYDGRKVLSGCVWCLQRIHAPSPRHMYIGEAERDGKKVPKLISHWGRCAKRSRGNQNKHHARLSARLHDEAEDTIWLRGLCRLRRFGKSIRTSAFARRTTGSRSLVVGRSLSCGCFTGAPHAKCGQLGRTLGIECSAV